MCNTASRGGGGGGGLYDLTYVTKDANMRDGKKIPVTDKCESDVFLLLPERTRGAY